MEENTSLSKNLELNACRTENVLVTIHLIKDNYLKWSAVIKIRISGREKFAYINEKMKEPDENDIRWNMWYLKENQVQM